MKIINSASLIKNLFINNQFNFKQWEIYINDLIPNSKKNFIDDMQQALNTGKVTFEKDFLPVLNNATPDNTLFQTTVKSFDDITKNLEQNIVNKFGKTIDVNIVLYLGLCNGAGWVIDINEKTYVLLGIEKIIELNWCDKNSMIGLIYHELGHVFQNQYCNVDSKFISEKENFLWQLYTEGVAMYFEQILINDFDFFHQDKNGWKTWCDKNISQIKNDFYSDLNKITFENQRYFGDWVNYNGFNDVGYYLGAKFLQFICKNIPFCKVLNLTIQEIEKLYMQFLNN